MISRCKLESNAIANEPAFPLKTYLILYVVYQPRMSWTHVVGEPDDRKKSRQMARRSRLTKWHVGNRAGDTFFTISFFMKTINDIAHVVYLTNLS